MGTYGNNLFMDYGISMPLQIVTHEMKLALTKGSGVLNLLAFFLIAATLFPFGVGPDSAILATIGIGIIWVCALLTSMLSLPAIFTRDYEDGTLEQLFMQGYAPEMVVLSKIFAHWCISCLPLVLFSPFLGYMFQLKGEVLLPLIFSLILGTPILSLIGAMGAALTLGASRSGALLGLLVLPLYIPVLIFGVSSIEISVRNGLSLSPFYMLIGLLLAMLPLTIFACSFTLAVAIEDA